MAIANDSGQGSSPLKRTALPHILLWRDTSMQAATADTLSDELVKGSEKKKLSRLERRRIAEDWAFILPQLIVFIFLTIVPFFVAIPILFTDMAQFNDPRINPVGLRNFTALFTDPSVQRDYLPALRRTIIFVVLNYATVYIFGLSLALLMYEVGFRGGFFTVVYLPLMVSGLAVGYMAVMLFSRETGTANLLLLELGLIKEPFDLYSAEGTAFILATTMCLIGSFAVFDELVAMGALYVNPEAKLLSILFFTYGFQVERLAMGMTLAVMTFLPLVFVGIALQRLQRRLQY